MGIVDPLATLQMGFWLSFGCVAALIYGSTQQNSTGRWQKWVMPQLIVFIGLFPLGIFFFAQAALLSPLANFITLPIINFLVIPPSLLALILLPFSSSLASLALNIAHEALLITWSILEKIANCSWAMWQPGTMPIFRCLLAFFGVIVLLAPKGFPGKMLGWFGFLPMFFYHPNLIPEGQCRVSVLDVGQGLAVVVQTRHHVLLYDAGPQYGRENDAGNRVIKPYLQAQQIKKIDGIIISHGDLDHRGGLNSLHDLLQGQILSSEPERLPQLAQHCVAPSAWEWDGVQ
ncbi:MAG TPA: ComEC/Rec2 family competence protein, partial [Candidatus Berkiella sp.]|nr:ComEC/Rec2 family competence protein [Candidatus Berkiella sp.]